MADSRPWPVETLMWRLPGPVRAAVIARCRLVRFATGQYLIRQGDLDQHAIVLLDGIVKIRIVDPSGYAAVLAVRRPGDIVGELGALTEEPRTASVLAATVVWGGVIGGRALQDIVAAHPAAAREVIRNQARRLNWANQRRIDFAAQPGNAKIARVLGDLAREIDGGPDGARIHLSQRELASLVGVGLNTVEAVLRRLADRGLVVRGYRAITVPDPYRLLAFADSEPRNRQIP